MAAIVKTFGGAISEARKAKGWALKDLASRVLREDKEAISLQYLNDIEHDRRSPPGVDGQDFADIEAYGVGLKSRRICSFLARRNSLETSAR